MSEFRNKFFIGHDLRRLSLLSNGADPYVGPLPGNKYPEHLTIVPPVLEKSPGETEKIIREIARIASTMNPFDVRPTGDASFNGQVMVTLVDGLDALHYAMLGILETHGYTDLYDHQFVGPNYDAHTSHLEGVLPPRELIHVDHISIFRSIDGFKYVDRRILLNGVRLND